MDADQWEAYYNNIYESRFLTLDDLSDETGGDKGEIISLIEDGFFGDLYEDGFFDEHAVSVLMDYLYD